MSEGKTDKGKKGTKTHMSQFKMKLADPKGKPIEDRLTQKIAEFQAYPQGLTLEAIKHFIRSLAQATELTFTHETDEDAVSTTEAIESLVTKNLYSV